MSEQVLDLQSVLSALRRHRRLVVAMTLLGALFGVAVVQIHPPMYSSQTQVLLPPPPDNASGTTSRDRPTDARVATSDVVLEPAGRSMSPVQTPAQVRSRIGVSSPGGNILTFVAKAPTAHEAEALADAVAAAEVSYQADADSSVSAAQLQVIDSRRGALAQQLAKVTRQIAVTKSRMQHEPQVGAQWGADATAMSELTAQQADLKLRVDDLQQSSEPQQLSPPAQVIESATPAKRSDLLLWNAIGLLLGAAMSFLGTTIVLIALRKRDQRLRTRDEVADALGSAVIGSLRTRPQRAAAGWIALMENYEPSVTDAWSLRQALDHVGLGDLTTHAGQAGSEKGSRAVRARKLTLITLSDDPRGLAVGPQLASHAAALGLRTRLVAGQGHESSAALWAACSSLRHTDEVRPGLHVDSRRRRGRDDLVVEMVVVDRRHPQFVGLDRNAVTLLSVSASSATAEDLARAAVAAYEAGGRISGVVVADPDSLDRTTGRLLLQQRSEQAPLPIRTTGVEAPAAGERAGGRAGR